MTKVSKRSGFGWGIFHGSAPYADGGFSLTLAKHFGSEAEGKKLDDSKPPQQQEQQENTPASFNYNS